ncbi:RNA polymerase sigma factor [Prevotella sp.]|uniref:RNA polymerase sigma factor n=1 Tax=Prevotella sp. TaxID=59823 RepID=UPI002F95C14B
MNLFSGNKEQQIIRMFGKGHPRAMDVLYADYAGYLSGVCARYVPNEEDLRDVLQESLIKVFTRIADFEYRGKGSLKAWLTRIVVNEALHFLRKQNPSMFVDTNMEQIDIADETPDVSTLSDERIAMLIGMLPPGYRTVFNLYVMEGKSHKEIAQILNIKPDTSASQYHKAKNMLAKLINSEKRKEDVR